VEAVGWCCGRRTIIDWIVATTVLFLRVTDVPTKRGPAPGFGGQGPGSCGAVVLCDLECRVGAAEA
jgi:hypothetical protein